MWKKHSIIISILLLCSYLLFCNTIYQSVTKKEAINPPVKEEQQDYYAYLEIPKLNLKQELFPKEDTRNQVDENVTILEPSELPDQEHSILILAAHSGTGAHAYFNQLDQLDIDDRIIVTYKQKAYQYQITKIYEERKTGTIHIPKEENQNQIILTTCSPINNNKQLIINGILIQKDKSI